MVVEDVVVVIVLGAEVVDVGWVDVVVVPWRPLGGWEA
jgi:hypothetical protein